MSKTANSKVKRLKCRSMSRRIGWPKRKISQAKRKNLAERLIIDAATKTAKLIWKAPAAMVNYLVGDRCKARDADRPGVVGPVVALDKKITVHRTVKAEDGLPQRFEQREADEVASDSTRHRGGRADRGEEERALRAAKGQGHKQRVGGHGKKDRLGEGKSRQGACPVAGVRPPDYPIVDLSQLTHPVPSRRGISGDFRRSPGGRRRARPRHRLRSGRPGRAAC